MRKKGIIHIAVADLLHKRRIELGINYRAAAEAADMDVNQYWQLEHGKKDMYLSTLIRMLAALDLELHLKPIKKRKAK